MSIIKQNARISNHRISATGSTFTVPPNEDFTSGAWTSTDLALGEIGINMIDDVAYMRTNNGIKKINSWVTSTYSNINLEKNIDFNYSTLSAPNIYTVDSYYNLCNGAVNNFYDTGGNIVNGFLNILGTSSVGVESTFNIINGDSNILSNTNNTTYNTINGYSNILDNTYYNNINGNGNTLNNIYNNIINANSVNLSAKKNEIITGDISIKNISGLIPDNRIGRVFGMDITKNATPKLFYFQGNDITPITYTIENNSAYYTRLTIIASDPSGNIKQFKGEGVIKNVAGTTSLVGSFTITSTFANAAMSSTSVSVAANNTTDSLDITVTGLASTHIQWVATIDYEKVSF